jgi:hypothetical protein
MGSVIESMGGKVFYFVGALKLVYLFSVFDLENHAKTNKITIFSSV